MISYGYNRATAAIASRKSVHKLMFEEGCALTYLRCSIPPRVSSRFSGATNAAPYLIVRAFPLALSFAGVSFSHNLAFSVFGVLTPPAVQLTLRVNRQAAGPLHGLHRRAGHRARPLRGRTSGQRAPNANIVFKHIEMPRRPCPQGESLRPPADGLPDAL